MLLFFLAVNQICAAEGEICANLQTVESVQMDKDNIKRS